MRRTWIQAGGPKHCLGAHAAYPQRFERFAPTIFESDAPRYTRAVRQTVCFGLFGCDERVIVVYGANLRSQRFRPSGSNVYAIARALSVNAGVHRAEYNAQTHAIAAKRHHEGHCRKCVADRIQTDDDNRWGTIHYTG
jgi:hypothetical protein